MNTRYAVWFLLALTVGFPARSAVPCDDHHVYGGQPQITRFATRETPQLLTNCGYVVCYSEARKNPLWVAYHLAAVGPVGEKAPNPKRKDNFRADSRTISKVGKEAFYYQQTGFDRGHMAPSYGIGSRFGEKAQDETFFMSNMAPQKSSLNQQTWRFLEELEANTLANGCAEVWIITGPIFTEPRKVIRKSGVEVPSAFFKLIVDETNGRPRVLAYRMEQTTLPTKQTDQFLTTVRAVEQATGLDFFWELPDTLETKIETNKPVRHWTVK